MKPEVPFIYLAGKYTEAHTYLVQRNIALAMHHAQEVAIMGALPVTPHLLTANMDGIQHYQWWCDVTMQLMRKCDAVLMLPNYDRSNGAVAELVEALRLDMPVFYCLGELRHWLADSKNSDDQQVHP